MHAGPSSRAEPARSLQGAAWLDHPATRRVLAALTAGGSAARVVGGAVRNALIGRPVLDIDIATTATPGEVVRLAAAAGLKSVPTGLAHGTITVIAEGQPFEVTTLRQDVETDGRHARVAFTADWGADAARRDFTINAIYCDAGGRLYDPVGGLNDIAVPRVRFIGDPGQRISEDALRILRFFRFSAQFVRLSRDGDGFDAEGLDACIARARDLATLSAERVRGELMKILAAPGAVGACRAMLANGILAPLLGVQTELARLEGLVALETRLDRPPDPVLRLAALAVGEPRSALILRDRLRLANSQVERLARTVHHPLSQQALSNALADDRAARQVLYGSGPDKQAFIDQLLLGLSVPNAADLTRVRALLDLAAKWQRPVPPYSGDVVMALGVPEGLAVGAVLSAFNRWWVAHDFPAASEATRDALARLANEQGQGRPGD